MKLILLVEGGHVDPNFPDLAALSAIHFQAGFGQLLKKEVQAADLHVEIRAIGSVTFGKARLFSAKQMGEHACLLRDLDGGVAKRERELARYVPHEAAVFFMVQTMEAWILSQPEVIEAFAGLQCWVRKPAKRPLGDSPLLKNKDIQEIQQPAKTLDTLLRQYFLGRNGKDGKPKAIRYASAQKHTWGPEMIGMLDPQKLKATFPDFQQLVAYL